MDVQILLSLGDMTVKELLFLAHKQVRHTAQILQTAVNSTTLFI